MNIAAYGNGSGSQLWRLEYPFKELRKRGIEAYVIDDAIKEDVVKWADIIILQSIVDKEGIAMIHAYQQERGKKLVVDTDDWIFLNSDNPYQMEHSLTNASEVMKITYGIADMVTTTQSYLAEKIKTVNPNVKVLPNYLHLETWDLPNKFKNESDEFRIGWAGSMTHLEDLKLVVNPLKRICKEYPQVKLIFIGDTRVGDLFDGCNVEATVGTSPHVWPSRLHSMRLDLGIAPLRDTEFNRCKSRIKFYEYSVAGYPGAYSPTIYKSRNFDGKVGMICENEEQWYRAIKNYIEFPQLRRDIATRAYAYVTRRFSLEKHIGEWIDAYNSLFDSKSKSDIH